MYKITFINALEKQLKQIPKADQKRIMEKIETLAVEPFPSGCKCLQGELSGHHRIRSGNYRVIYNVDLKKKTILVLKIAHRQNIYD